MTRHVIIGKGAVGTTLAHHLADEGNDVLVLSRSGGTSAGRITHAAVDATDADALTAATRGAEVVYNCAAPPYHRWPTDWPPLWAAMLDAAARTGAVLVVGRQPLRVRDARRRDDRADPARQHRAQGHGPRPDVARRRGPAPRGRPARHRDPRRRLLRAVRRLPGDARPPVPHAAARRQGGADGHRRRPAAQLDLPARPRPHARRRRPDARRLGARLARPDRGAADRARAGRTVRRRRAGAADPPDAGRARACARASCRRCCGRSRPSPTTSPSPTSWTPPRPSRMLGRRRDAVGHRRGRDGRPDDVSEGGRSVGIP